jgi:hypothetical protein
VGGGGQNKNTNKQRTKTKQEQRPRMEFETKSNVALGWPGPARICAYRAAINVPASFEKGAAMCGYPNLWPAE